MSDWDESFDFIVVGSGGGSMCAAVYLQARGKRVLILEKTELVGGTTARSGGVMWIPNNPFMRRDGVADSYEQAATYLDSVLGEQVDAPGATRARRHTYLTEAPRMVDFLLSQGIKLTRVSSWPDYYDDRPGGSVPGRTVVAELFDVNELGPWKTKLRPGFLTVPAMLEEALELPKFRTVLESQGPDAQGCWPRGRRQADRQALGHGRQGPAGPHVAGGLARRCRDSHRGSGA